MKKILLFSILIAICWLFGCSNSSFNSDDRLPKQNIEGGVIADQNIQWYSDPLQMAQKVIIYFNYSLVAAILLLILPIRKVFSRASQINQSQLDRIDPVLLMLFYRKGDLHVKDFLAGVFSLYRTGLLETKIIKSQPRFEEDPHAPNRTIRFTFQGNIKEFKRDYAGKGSDIYLLKWLFKNTTKGMRFFVLSSIAGPTEQERKRKISRKSYRLKLQQFYYSFREWKEKAEQDYGSNTWFNDLPLKLGLRLLVVSLYVLILYISIIQAKAWIDLLFAILILGGLVVLAIKKYKKKRYTVVYLLACIFVGPKILNEDVSFFYFISLLLSYLFVAIVPRKMMSLEAVQYYEAVLRRRRVLKKGGYPINGDPSKLQTMTEQAILLGVGQAFILKHQQKFLTELSKELPTIYSEEAVRVIQYTNKTLRVLPKESISSSSSGDSGGGSSGDPGWWDWTSDSGDGGGSSDGGGGGGE